MRRLRSPVLAILVCHCVITAGCAQRLPSLLQNSAAPLAAETAWISDAEATQEEAKQPTTIATDGPILAVPSPQSVAANAAAKKQTPPKRVTQRPRQIQFTTAAAAAEAAAGDLPAEAAAQEGAAQNGPAQNGPAQKGSAQKGPVQSVNAQPPAPADATLEQEQLPAPTEETNAPQRGAIEPELIPPPGSGPLITLHVDNQPITKVLEMISRQAEGVSILVSPGINGAITIDLRNKTVDEALQILSKQCRLAVHRENDVIYVSTLNEARQIEEDDLPVRVYHLNYVRSTDVQAMVKPLLSKKGVFTVSPDAEAGLPSDALSLSSSSATVGSTTTLETGGNSMAGGDIVVVQDYEFVLRRVDAVIQQIDVQPIQVLIEAVIVQVRLEKGMELGVNFGLLDGAGNALAVMGSGAAINSAAGFAPASVLAAGGMVKGTPASGFAQAPPGLKFGFVDETSTGFIKALEKWGETKVLACPRVLVLNKQRAEIHLGERLGYQTATQTVTSTVQTVNFMNVGTQLRLRPFVSEDGMIRLEVHPERSSGALDSAGIPQVNAAQVTTNVILPDGATIVIGGLIESEVQARWSGLPLLSRIPVIGWVFRETIEETRKRELVVLLTPRIWCPNKPEALNYVQPRTLGMDGRTAQCPKEEMRDSPTLYQTLQPDGCAPDELPRIVSEEEMPEGPVMVAPGGPSTVHIGPQAKVQAKGKPKVAEKNPSKLPAWLRK